MENAFHPFLSLSTWLGGLALCTLMSRLAHGPRKCYFWGEDQVKSLPNTS